MINPETNEVVAALRVLSLADTMGHSLTTEEANGQARAAVIDLEYCADGELKTAAVKLAQKIESATSADSVTMARGAPDISEAAEGLRYELSLLRVNKEMAA